MFDLETIAKRNAQAERAYFARQAAFSEPSEACEWAFVNAQAPFTAFILDGRTILVQPRGNDCPCPFWFWTDHVCPVHPPTDARPLAAQLQSEPLTSLDM